jgi:hypothetical protein
MNRSSFPSLMSKGGKKVKTKKKKSKKKKGY